jgi:hypothetical protein
MMIRCPNCNRQHPRSVVTCDCGFDLQAYAEKLDAAQKERATESRPYNILPTFLTILRVLGVLSMLGGLIYAVALFLHEDPAWTIFVAFFGGILAGVPYLAISEALTILLHMSEKQDHLMLLLDRVEKKA